MQTRKGSGSHSTEVGGAAGETCPALWPKNHIFVEKYGLPFVQNLNKSQTLSSTRHNKTQAEKHRPWEGDILDASEKCHPTMNPFQSAG